MSVISQLVSRVQKVLDSYVVSINNRNGKIILNQDVLSEGVAPNKVILGSGVKKITVSTTPPVTPEVGDLWIDIS